MGEKKNIFFKFDTRIVVGDLTLVMGDLDIDPINIINRFFLFIHKNTP